MQTAASPKSAARSSSGMARYSRNTSPKSELLEGLPTSTASLAKKMARLKKNHVKKWRGIPEIPHHFSPTSRCQHWRGWRMTGTNFLTNSRKFRNREHHNIGEVFPEYLSKLCDSPQFPQFPTFSSKLMARRFGNETLK